MTGEEKGGRGKKKEKNKDIMVPHGSNKNRLIGATIFSILFSASLSKLDEFSEKFQGARGHFQSKNLYCRFCTFFGHFPKKMCNIFFGGSKGVWNFSESSSDLVVLLFT